TCSSRVIGPKMPEPWRRRPSEFHPRYGDAFPVRATASFHSMGRELQSNDGAGAVFLRLRPFGLVKFGSRRDAKRAIRSKPPDSSKPICLAIPAWEHRALKVLKQYLSLQVSSNVRTPGWR